MIKCIVFDVGGVLIKYKDNHFSKYFAKKVGISTALQKRAWYKHLHLAESGKISIKEFWKRYCRAIGKHIPARQLTEIEYEYFKPRVEAKKLAMKLKKKYRVGILSNWAITFNKVNQRYKITKGFDFSIISFRTGFVKPQRPIYKLLLKKAKCRPEEVLYIDDYQRFLKPARKFGVKCIQFRTFSKLKKDLKKHGVRIV